MSHEWDRARADPDLDDYARGYLDGIAAYAWWKDGTQYVGTTGRTLNEATIKFLEAPRSTSNEEDRF